MKLKSISYLLLPVLLAASAIVQAQEPMSLYFMESIPQTSHINPAHRPRANVYVAFLPVNFNINVRSGLAVRDIFQQHGDKWYLPIEKQFDYNKLYKSIGKKSTAFNAGLDMDLSGVGYRTRKGYLNFNMSLHVTSLAALPSDLFKIPESGFPDNTTLDFSPLRVHVMSYMQLLVGYSRAINDRLRIGVNLKPLIGLAAATTDISKFTLHTAADEWRVEMEGNAYTSLAGGKMVEDLNGNMDDFEMPDLSKMKDYIGSLFSNRGFAVDLGATYILTDRITLSAALNNFGFISWKGSLNGVSVNGQYSFEGIEYDASKDDFDDVLSEIGDTLKNVMSFRAHHKNFKTAMTPSFYLGGTYQLTPAISLSLLSRSTFWKKSFRQNFNLSVNLQPYSFVSFTVGVNKQIKGSTYLGTGLSLYLGPLQFYLLSDYVPLRYSTLTLNDDKIPFVPERQKEFVFRTGLNFVFGKNGYESKPMMEKRTNQWK
jgi:hypothetical protein